MGRRGQPGNNYAFAQKLAVTSARIRSSGHAFMGWTVLLTFKRSVSNLFSCVCSKARSSGRKARSIEHAFINHPLPPPPRRAWLCGSMVAMGPSTTSLSGRLWGRHQGRTRVARRGSPRSSAAVAAQGVLQQELSCECIDALLTHVLLFTQQANMGSLGSQCTFTLPTGGRLRSQQKLRGGSLQNPPQRRHQLL